MRLCSAICLRTDGHGVEAGPGKRRNHGVREVELRLSLMPANSTRAYLIALLAFPFESSRREFLVRGWRTRGRGEAGNRSVLPCANDFIMASDVLIKLVSFRCRYFDQITSHWLPFWSLMTNKLINRFASSTCVFPFFIPFLSFFEFSRLDRYQSEEVYKSARMTRGSDNTRLNAIVYHDIHPRHISTGDKLLIDVDSSQMVVSWWILILPRRLTRRWTFIAFVIVVF